MGNKMNKILSFFIFYLLTPVNSQSQQIKISTSKELINLFSSSVDSIEVILSPGDYYLTPTEIIDSTCGNCEDANTLVKATAGLQITGKHVSLSGPKNNSAVIHTNAGYGLFINDCQNFVIENLVITGGDRDTSGMATDAAIVIKNSNAVIRNNIIRDNIGDSLRVVKNVVGIMGICGRENSELRIENSQIIRNSWDGIALYRGAKAVIVYNVVDGVDKAISKIAGGGRGVAIGITWNAEAVVEQNLIKRYWKGLGCFVDAKVEAKNNIIEDLLTWGIAYWDADKGKPTGIFTDNIIYSTGACGISVASVEQKENIGRLTGNVIIAAAQNPKYDSPDYYCYQCALALHAKPEAFIIEENIFYNNRRATNDLPDYDLSAGEFSHLIEKIVNKVSQNNFYDISIIKEYIDSIP